MSKPHPASVTIGGVMRLLAASCGLASLLVLSSCSVPAPGFCCLTLENCAMFEVDEVRECEGEQVCVENQCVPTPDAPLVDGRPDGPGPDAADPCVVAGGQIVFTTDRDGDFEVARMWADGTAFQPLTSNTWADGSPRWSSEGDLIAYTSTPGANADVWVMSADGSGGHLAAANTSGAVWSPTADQLLVVRYQGTGSANDIYRVAADGTGLTRLTPGDNGTYFEPSWAPDGSRIVYSGNGEIYAMDADGGNQLNVGSASGRKPAWSPSGKYIAFSNAGLVRMLSNGLAQTSLFPSTPLHSLEWSPDSLNVVVCVGGNGQACDIHVVRASDGESTAIATSANSSDPHWSPDGQRIVFTSTRDGNEEVYVANADGTSPTNVSMNAAADRSARWTPCSQ